MSTATHGSAATEVAPMAGCASTLEPPVVLVTAIGRAEGARAAAAALGAERAPAVLHVGMAAMGALLEDPLAARCCAALLRGDADGDRALRALVVLELLERGMVVALARRRLDWVRERRALFGSLPPARPRLAATRAAVPARRPRGDAGRPGRWDERSLNGPRLCAPVMPVPPHRGSRPTAGARNERKRVTNSPVNTSPGAAPC